MSELDMSDPYLQPNGTLKNLHRLTDASKLRELEYLLVEQRSFEIVSGQFDIPKTFDEAHLKAIHKHLFQDTFEWAGFMRHEPVVLEGERVQLGPMLQKGESVFLPSSYIRQAIAHLSRDIQTDPRLKSPDAMIFADGAAKILGDLNHVRPFREGNGRTQRLFIQGLAQSTGHGFDFRVVSAERNIAVSISANSGQLEPLQRMLRGIIDPRQVAVLRQAIVFLESQDINWNSRYFAAAAPGFAHTANLVANNPQFALLMEGQGDSLRLVVTHPDHLPVTAQVGKEVSFKVPELTQEQGKDLEY
ncbi:Fic family protein [uncultured Meiothermus sp.]|uniref:Fic/DOC family protein n=1 Tax=uncultured Meiothermus sp. TaxID=157471 RepID=UPI0026349260|nr:Fic family protein [uncultured Meiothermus sp.]